MNTKSIISLSLSTLLYACVGPVVKTIPLDAGIIVLGRAICASLAVSCIMLTAGIHPFRDLSLRHIGLFVVMGLLMSGNWYLYFLAIKVSTVAVAVLALFTYPLITALLEPLLLKGRVQVIDIIGALFVVAGVSLIVPRFTITNTTTQGALLGVVSGMCFAIYSILNRKAVVNNSVRVMMFYQFTTAAIFFTIAGIPAMPVKTDPITILKIILLGAVLTTFAQILFVNTLKYVPASTASIFSSLQPLLTVLLAIVLIHEIPGVRTIIGGSIICTTVVLVTILHLKKKGVSTFRTIDAQTEKTGKVETAPHRL